MIGQGVSSRSSHSAAAGRTTFSEKPWTQSRMSFWSWLSSSVNFGSPCSEGVLLASSRSALASTSATVAESDMSAEVYTERCRVRKLGRRSNVAQIERAQPFVAFVGAVEETAVDAAVGL